MESQHSERYLELSRKVAEQYRTLPHHERVTAMAKAFGRTLYLRSQNGGDFTFDDVVWDSLSTQEQHVAVRRMLHDIDQLTMDTLMLIGALNEVDPRMAGEAMHDGFVEYEEAVKDDAKEEGLQS
jgi:hypothetical protein